MLPADEPVRSRIRRFMEDQFLVEFDEVGETANLFQLGYLDSFGYVMLMTFLKDELHVPVVEQDMLDHVLVSLDTVVAFAERGRREAG
jgi:D-alanine--poly(phosphoribitol) ligase subunit 2